MDPKKKQVLICEDEFLIALSYCDLLEHHGHDIVGTARNSVAALDLALREEPDLAIVDLNLADGWTGPALVQRLATEGVFCIVVTGQCENYQNDGSAAAVFRKPVHEGQLMNFIDRLA